MTEKKLKPVVLFFSPANEIKTCGVVQRLIAGHAQRSYLTVVRLSFVNGDPPLSKNALHGLLKIVLIACIKFRKVLN